MSAATGRSTNERVAHEPVVKGYARPAFGGTSRRRSIMKNRQLSRWVTFCVVAARCTGGTCFSSEKLQIFWKRYKKTVYKKNKY